jgi:hypothetical protein
VPDPLVAQEDVLITEVTTNPVGITDPVQAFVMPVVEGI